MVDPAKRSLRLRPVARGYRMLCPITRALDRVGDRWTLLVLRDLHAGPMRFGELQTGLPGLASNLLATRLDKLQDDGFISRDGNTYALTELGERTAPVLWELARLGIELPPDPELRRPGHLRLVAVTLQAAMQHVLPEGLELRAQLVLDDEPFSIDIAEGAVRIRYGAPDDPEVVAVSSYEPMMAAAGGELSLAPFRAEHVEVEGKRAAVRAFVDLMTRVMTKGFAATR